MPTAKKSTNKTASSTAKTKTKTNQTSSPEYTEQYAVRGKEVLEKVKEILREGNARSVLVQNKEGATIFEIPVTFGVIGVALAPTFAAVGALVALLTSCTITVVKRR